MRNKGFTLIELVVVIAIIGLLTALANVNFMQARARARDVQRKSELKAIQNALEMYKDDQIPQSYPNTTGSIQTMAAYLTTPGYMATLPQDPKVKASAGSWDDYQYAIGADPSVYTITACLENTGDPEGGASCHSNQGVTYILTQP